MTTSRLIGTREEEDGVRGGKREVGVTDGQWAGRIATMDEDRGYRKFLLLILAVGPVRYPENNTI